MQDQEKDGAMTVTKKQAAEAYRTLAEWERGTGPPRHDAALEYTARADRLDPPRTTCPDGTLAWTCIGGEGSEYLLVKVPGGWADKRNEEPLWDDDEVVAFEVIPTVPEGHVTLPGDLLPDAVEWTLSYLEKLQTRSGAGAKVLDAYMNAVEAWERS